MTKKQFIIEQLAANKNLVQIGEALGVSRQRVYQLLAKYNIPTPERLKRTQVEHTEKTRWLYRLLNNKGLDKSIYKPIREYLSDKLPDYCPILGIKLNYTQAGRMQDDSPSIDRIDSSRNYQPNNVHVISWRANRIKNDSNSQELRKIADYLEKLQN